MKNIENRLGYIFKKKSLLEKALRHSSIKRFAHDFERLEFLGDRVLGLIIAEYTYKQSDENEGVMSRFHAASVCAGTCMEIALKIGINEKIETAGMHLRTNKTVLADAMEAVLGGVFLDSDYETTKEVVLNLWKGVFDKYKDEDQEPKTRLQEVTQARFGVTPDYELLSVEGPDHAPIFTIKVEINNNTVLTKGKSRKEAETLAAKEMIELLKRNV